MKVKKTYWITEQGSTYEMNSIHKRGFGMDLASFLSRWKEKQQSVDYNGYANMECAMEEHMRKMRW